MAKSSRTFWGNAFLLWTALDFAAPAAEKAGADWWSLQPIKPPELPVLSNASWARNSIDAFVLTQLTANQLAPSKEADRRTLIRRLSYDLTGLPPSPKEVEAFVNDQAPDAYEKVVNRLLASPHYGERWARHWLDVVHYGESHGFEYNQPRNHSWPYRNWVIRALNDDLPYDRFVQMQIAGDVLAPKTVEGVIAAGFLVTGPHNTTRPNNDTMRRTMRQDELEGLVGMVGQTFLGLTVNCARCHDHKFDPISQKDYYSLTAALNGVHPGERDLKGMARRAPASKAQRVYTVLPQNPGVTQVLDRGNVLKPIGAVAPAGIPALKTVKADFGLANNAPDKPRRAKLAEWITHADNPLFGRVIANRVWHYHFGAGLVSTPNDFGFSGTRPSHPELLDHLAVYLAQKKWSLKALHRYIVTSATYRQTSRLNPAAMKIDAGNRLLWRMSPRRMAAEEMRDTMLAASGKLNRELGGVGYRDVREYKFKGSHFYDIIAQDKPEQFRRTIYRFSPRGARRNLLDTFDCPDASALTPARASTTTPLQSLALMNNRFVLRQSDFFAERLKAEAGERIPAQLRLAHQLTLGRAVAAREFALAETFVKAHGMAAYCRVLLNTNAFLYVR